MADDLNKSLFHVSRPRARNEQCGRVPDALGHLTSANMPGRVSEVQISPSLSPPGLAIAEFSVSWPLARGVLREGAFSLTLPEPARAAAGRQSPRSSNAKGRGREDL